MALVYKVKTPLFFSEKEPYMLVFFVEEYNNIFRTGACDNPRYMQVYDLRLIYPEIDNAYEAKNRFVEEMKVGSREPVKLYEFTISNLTYGKHSSVWSSFFEKETHLRIGVYDNNDERVVARRMLSFGIEHGLFEWDD